MSLRHNYNVANGNNINHARLLTWGVVPPIPELTSGKKVKGTKTRGHTMTDIGTSMMTGK